MIRLKPLIFAAIGFDPKAVALLSSTSSWLEPPSAYSLMSIPSSWFRWPMWSTDLYTTKPQILSTVTNTIAIRLPTTSCTTILTTWSVTHKIAKISSVPATIATTMATMISTIIMPANLNAQEIWLINLFPVPCTPPMSWPLSLLASLAWECSLALFMVLSPISAIKDSQR